MPKIKINYPEDLGKYVEMSSKYCIYNDIHRESSLKNSYKQLLKHGFKGFDDFHEYVLSFKEDYHKYYDELNKMCKKGCRATFYSLMRVMTEEKA